MHCDMHGYVCIRPRIMCSRVHPTSTITPTIAYGFVTRASLGNDMQGTKFEINSNSGLYTCPCPEGVRRKKGGGMWCYALKKAGGNGCGRDV